MRHTTAHSSVVDALLVLGQLGHWTAGIGHGDRALTVCTGLGVAGTGRGYWADLGARGFERLGVFWRVALSCAFVDEPISSTTYRINHYRGKLV